MVRESITLYEREDANLNDDDDGGPNDLFSIYVFTNRILNIWYESMSL